MNQYKIAGRVISFRAPCAAPWEEDIAAQFLCDGAPSDAVFEVTEEEFREVYDEWINSCRKQIESWLLLNKLGDWMIEADCLYLHASAVSRGGNGFCFTGPSGAGKSTHANLWKQTFPDAVIINDDKVTLRKVGDGKFVVGTTPWHGKEAVVNNIEAPLKGIAVICQARENRVFRLSREEALETLMGQIRFAQDAGRIDRQMTLIEEILNTVPFWRLECTIDQEAALLCERAMSEADG